MELTLKITDEQLDAIKAALRVTEADYNLAHRGAQDASVEYAYAKRILRARKALGLSNEKSQVVTNEL